MSLANRLLKLAAPSARRKRLDEKNVGLWHSLQPMSLPLRKMGFRITSTRRGQLQLLYKDTDIRITFIGDGNAYVSAAMVESPTMTNLTSAVTRGLASPYGHEAYNLWHDVDSEQMIEKSKNARDLIAVLKALAVRFDKIREILADANHPMPEASSE